MLTLVGCLLPILVNGQNTLKRISITPSSLKEGYVVRYHTAQLADSFAVERNADTYISLKIWDQNLQTRNLKLPEPAGFIQRVDTVRSGSLFTTRFYVNNPNVLKADAYPDRNGSHLLMALYRPEKSAAEASEPDTAVVQKNVHTPENPPADRSKTAENPKKQTGRNSTDAVVAETNKQPANTGSPTDSTLLHTKEKPVEGPTARKKDPSVKTGSLAKADTLEKDSLQVFGGRSPLMNLEQYRKVAQADGQRSSLDIPALHDTLSELSQRVSRITDQHLQNHHLLGKTSSVSELREMFNFNFADTATSPQLQILRAQKRIKQQDYGLSIESDYRGTSRNGLFSRARIQVGLDWDILSSGWYETRQTVDQLQTEMVIEKQQFERQQFEKYYGYLFNRFISYFNSYKKRISKKYLNLLDQQRRIAERLHQLNYISRTELLDVYSKNAQIRNRIQNFELYNRQLDSRTKDTIQVQQLPVFDLNYKKLHDAALRQSSFKHRYSNLNLSNYQTYDWLTDVSLSFFMDYNINSSINVSLTGGPDEFTSNMVGNENFFSYGLRLSIPFPLNTDAKEDLARARRRKLKRDLSRRSFTITKELSNHYYEYKYRLEDYIEMHRKYLQINEQIENELTKKRLNDPTYRPRKVLSLLNTRYDVALETIDIKQQLYLKLLTIYRYVHPTPITAFADLRPVTIGKRDTTNYSVYIWSSTFEQKSNEFLLNFLQKRPINTIYLSPGPSPEISGKVRQFIRSANKIGMRIALMLGSNDIIFGGQRDDLEETIQQAAKLGANEVHLDVEPHTFEDWEQNRKTYQNLYISMIREASKRTHKENLTLSVSIPTYYDDIIDSISKYVDQFNIMAYKTKKVDTIRRRTSYEFANIPHKATLTLNLSEFKNLKEFNALVEKIQAEMGVNTIAMHDLEALLRLNDISLKSD